MILIAGFQTLQNIDRIWNAWLVDIDFLESAHQCPVFLEELTVLLVGRRTNAAHRSGRKRRLQQIGRIHCSARRGSGTDDRVNFINEQNGTIIFFDFFHDLLEAFFKVATIAGSGQQCAHIQRENSGGQQHFGNIAIDDPFGQPLGNGCLANTWIPHQKRIVLLPTTQHLHNTLHFAVPSDQGVDLAVGRLFIQIHTIGRQRIRRLFIIAFFGFDGCGIFIFRASHGACLGHAGPLGNAVADVVHSIITRHVLFLQEISRMTFPLGKDRNQNIRSGYFFAPG